MSVLMEQCQWCAREVTHFASMYDVSGGTGATIRVCHECRWSQVHRHTWRHIKHYLSMCTTEGYNIHTPTDIARARHNNIVAYRARTLQ